MRLVIRLEDHQKAERFSLYLRERQIKCQLEQKPTESNIWVFDEDDIKKAQSAFKDFENDPGWQPSQATLEEKKIEEMAALDKAEIEVNANELSEESMQDELQEDAPVQAKSSGTVKLTVWVTVFCVFLFIWSAMNAPKPMEHAQYTLDARMMFNAPYDALVYENPMAYQYARDLIDEYNRTENPAAYLKTPGALEKLYLYQSTPYWHGIYETYLVPGKPYQSLNKAFTPYPTFTQIGQGEVWRVVTPAFLHASFLHIFFNLIWFIFLGNQIERRIGFWKFLLFIILVAAVSNTAQYLMSGPNFLGLSGVITGMAAFVYIRQSKAAWEGYSIQRPALYFLGFYVVALFALQLVSFGLELAGKMSIAPNIANTAHIIGALMGFALGSLNFFSAWNLGKLNK